MATRTRRLVASVLVLGASILLATAPVNAHDDIASSEPESGTVVDEPITEVTIEFGVPVNDDVELALFGPGDDNLIKDTTTVILSPTTARIEFAPVEEEGMYIVRYLTTATIDQHFLVGAVSFTYGSTGGGSGVNWLLLAIVAIVILSIGTAWSYRLHRRQQAEANT